MNWRERQEQIERETLSPQACRSQDSKGRKEPEDQCEMRTVFQRDRDRIIHSKSFRRLKHKTQVFISPEGDHYRTRLTHTLEVSQIARTIARALRLNEDLVEAIAMGHDLGHTPFGHSGEHALNKLNPAGFKHNEHSLKIVDFIETKANHQGLNLTWEVRDGILNHTGSGKAQTLEGQIVGIADRIAYINHDIDDAIRAGVLQLDQIPSDLLDVLGRTHSKRIETMILSVVLSSENQTEIKMNSPVQEATLRLRQFLFDTLYHHSIAKREEEKIHGMIEQMYEHYKNHPDHLPEEHLAHYAGTDDNKDDIITDYIAGMSDRFALMTWEDLFLPKVWNRL